MQLAELIHKSKELRGLLDELINLIVENNDLNTQITDSWRVKDLMAHISWHERQMENLFITMNLQGSEYWLLSNKERNEKIFNDNYHINEDQCLIEYKQSFLEMMIQMNKLPEKSPIDPSLFSKMPLDWEPWKVIAGNTFDHYVNHINQLKNNIDYLNK